MSDPTPPPIPRPAYPPPAYPPDHVPAVPHPIKSPRRLFAVTLAVIVAVAVLTAVITIPILIDGDGPAIVGGAATEATDVNLDDVEVIEMTNTTHTREEVEYDTSPPVGGPHHPVWLDCGVYDEPVPEENVVHDLEHGTVWITYRPGLSDEDVAALTELLPQNGILSPHDDLQAPVLVTVWGTRLELTGADDPRLSLFITQYGAGETAPEPMSSCAGGLRNPPPIAGAGTEI